MPRIGKNCLSQHIAAICLILGLSARGPAAFAYRNYDYSGTGVTQESAQTLATKINNDGSDDSEDDGIKHGTIALNCLGAMNIGCAFHYGYKGYGNYINSQKLDDLHKVTRRLDGTMSSIGYGAVGGSGTGDTATQNAQSEISGASKRWADKDTAFLYKGEMNEVAAQFEKASGMSREALFKHIASGVDARLTWDDPNLLSKLEQHYQSFIAEMPAGDFRGNLEKAHSLFNLAKKLDVLDQFRDFYVKNRYEGKAPAEETKLAAADSRPGQAQAAAGGAPAEPDRGVASVDSGSPQDGSGRAAAPGGAGTADEAALRLSREDGMFLGLDVDGSRSELFNDIQDGDTIFRMVSKRYRKLAPALIGKAAMIKTGR